MKYKLSNQELQEQWDSHMLFLEKSCDSFDEGLFIEAKRLAVSLRVLFHQTLKSFALCNQLNYENQFLLWSSAYLYTPSNLSSSWTLLRLDSNAKGITYIPILQTNSGRTFFLNVEDWWNEIIFDDKKNFFSRKDIVLSVANQDGGAHIAPEFKDNYADILKRNSLGKFTIDGEEIQPLINPVYAAVRQIAFEVLSSWRLFGCSFQRTIYEDRKFEMRFVDDYRRFKWSTTDVNASDETLSIVNQYHPIPRKYYIDKFANGERREVIIP